MSFLVFSDFSGFQFGWELVIVLGKFGAKVGHIQYNLDVCRSHRERLVWDVFVIFVSIDFCPSHFCIGWVSLVVCVAQYVIVRIILRMLFTVGHLVFYLYPSATQYKWNLYAHNSTNTHKNSFHSIYLICVGFDTSAIA